ncbi:hypothetical protein [Serinicoccus sp. CUA-874]|uniref:hypothetical protein n=1 Tax=Serinicoccus sp. CUA-874 TaxID=1517939 RepID=UPI00192D03F7|nr:hypothetical protein [Serinicoccus sp. CUA-874]
MRAIDELLEAMTWRIVSRYAALAGTTALLDAPSVYALLDGLFEQALVAAADDPQAAADQLGERVAAVLPRLLA